MKKRGLSIRGKFVLLFAALAVLLSLGVGFFAYSLNSGQIIGQYAALSSNAAALAARAVDTAAVERYFLEGEDQSYADTEAELKAIKESFGLRFLYIFVPSETENDERVLFDVATGAEDAAYTDSLGDHTGPVDVYETTLAVFQSGQPAQDAAITRGQYGYLISAYAPVLKADGEAVAVVGVDMDMNRVMGEVRSQTLKLSGLAAGVILVFLAGVLVVLNRQVIRPVNLLSSTMSAFDKDADTLSIDRVNVRTGDEIELMADSFNQMAEDIKQYVENLKAVTAEKERIAAELGVAKEIQSSMLPSIFTFIPKRNEFAIFATMEPAKEVGGDFYDFFIINGTHLGFVIADVSGKGVPAALFMVIAKTLIKNHALLGESPAEALRNANDQLCENNDAGMFVTVFMGMAELATGKLTFANAGHNHPLIRHEGKYEWLKEKPGFVLAGMENVRYTDHTRQLAPGDRLFLYTDGVTEALNTEEALFSDPRLLETLEASEEQAPDLHACLQFVRAAIADFAGDAEQADDITMLGLDWRDITAKAAAVEVTGH